MVIATFSCLLTIISIETAYSTPSRDDINITMDPLRLAAQIVSGIGFLGAGVILRKGNDSITGLTTAAMIWGAAGIGIAVGAGFYLEALTTVIIVVIGVELIAPFLLKIGPKRIRMREALLKARLVEKVSINQLIEFMNNHEMYIDHIRIKEVPISKDQSHFEVVIRFSTVLKNENQTIIIFNKLHSLPYIYQMEIEILA